MDDDILFPVSFLSVSQTNEELSPITVAYLELSLEVKDDFT